MRRRQGKRLSFILWKWETARTCCKVILPEALGESKSEAGMCRGTHAMSERHGMISAEWRTR